jgi:uncharacterized membrane protein YoaT (DUF817 family)
VKEALEIFKKHHNQQKYNNPDVFKKGSTKIIDGILYGIPLYFYSANTKKRYNMHRTRPEPYYLCTYEEALLRHNFYYWLWQFPKLTKLYLCYDGIVMLNQHPGKPCVYLEITKNSHGRLIMIDHDILP